METHGVAAAKTSRAKSFAPIGYRRWVIAEGWIPPTSHAPIPALISHEVACILNVSDRDAQVEITIFYADTDPVGPYKIVVPARRANHVSFNPKSEIGRADLP